MNLKCLLKNTKIRAYENMEAIVDGIPSTMKSEYLSVQQYVVVTCKLFCLLRRCKFLYTWSEAFPAPS